MASAVEYALILDELDSEAQAAHELDPKFFYKIVTLACTRLPLLNLVFGDVAEGAHESLPLAMLRAFINARLSSLSLLKPTESVPETGEVWGPVLCCDNFT